MGEKVIVTAADIGTVNVGDTAAKSADEFEGCSPLPGHEQLGRAIVDKRGFPSGSPANYEALRANALATMEKEFTPPTQTDIDSVVGTLLSELGE